MESRSDCQPPRHLITVIHGTFARAADWIKAGSDFQTALQSRLLRSASFHTFRWSGANSHHARKRASADLVAHIRKLNQEFPDSVHILVAHSHGGNVACYALDDAEVRKSVRLIVTLGTPFILCKARQIGGAAKFLAVISIDALALVLAVGLCFAIYTLEGEQLFRGREGVLVRIVLLAGMLGTWLVLMMVTSRLPNRLIAWLRRRQSRVQNRLRMPALDDAEVLSFVAERDEAGALLWGLHRLANVPAYLFRRASPVFSRMGEDISENDPSVVIEALGKVLVYSFCLAILAVPYFIVWGLFSGDVSTRILTDWTESWPVLLITIWAIGMTALFLLSVLAQLLMLTVPPFVRAHRFGFGGESPLDNWLADIHAVDDPALAFPQARSKCIYRGVSAAELAPYRRAALLRHSQLYSATVVVDAIAEHINASARRWRVSEA